MRVGVEAVWRVVGVSQESEAGITEEGEAERGLKAPRVLAGWDRDMPGVSDVDREEP